jgi:2-keto-4-pentenoate hydratase
MTAGVARTCRETTERRATVRTLQELADRQWRDYRARRPGTCFADPDFALPLAAAYEVQDAVAQLRIAAGDRLIGYKIGCTGPGIVRQFGMQGPIRGCLFESEIRRHGDALNFEDFANLAIEGEMAVRIAPDGTIAAAFPVIELHHFVFRGARKTLPELVANNGLNGGFVLPHDGWLSSKLCTERKGILSVGINGRLAASGVPWPMSGAIDSSLEWLRQHLANFRTDLLAGQIVLTGTPLGLYPVRRGDQVAVLVDDEMAALCSVV